MPTYTLYDLGSKGVNVDKDEVHSEPTEFSSAQNVIRDPLGVSEGITNRPGLVKFNSAAAAGSIVGGVGVPLRDALSATSVATFYWSRMNTARQALGWNTSTTAFTVSPTVAITSGTPANPMGQNKAPGLYYLDAAAPFWYGTPGCIYNNKLYYASDDFTHNVTAPKIRVFDGVIDGYLCSISYNPDVGAGTQSFGVITMISANGTIYLTTLDGGTSDTTFRGRVYQMEPATGTLTQLGATIVTGEVPYSLCYAFNKLWLGTLHSIDSTVVGKIYTMRPGIDTAWTLDANLPANICGVTALCPYRGEMYASCIANTGTVGVVRKRTTLGVWSTSQSGDVTTKTNGYASLSEFKGNLYTYYNHFTGSGSEGVWMFDGTSWTQVSGAFGPAEAFSISYPFNGQLYFGATARAAGSDATRLARTDGTTFSYPSFTGSGHHGGVFGVIVT